jgi:Arc/MetJ-type ribon-helix-helix transcriptional regulator
MLYGMNKTTVYVPPEVKRALGRLASARGTSEAELIREALRKIVDEAPAPRPRLPLIESGKPMLAESLDEALEGFGTR